MLSGFDRAVGPVHPAERPPVAPYICQIAMQDVQPERCAFALYDAGVGKTYVECITHGYAVMAVDWTATQFGGGRSLAEHIELIRARFAQLKTQLGGRIDDTVPTVRVSRDGEVFDAITRNLEATIEAVANKEEGTNGTQPRNTEADHGR